VIAARAGAQSANQRAAANPADADAMKQMIAAEAGLSGRSASSSRSRNPIPSSRRTRR